MTKPSSMRLALSLLLSTACSSPSASTPATGSATVSSAFAPAWVPNAVVARPQADLPDGGADMAAVTIDIFQLTGPIPESCDTAFLSATATTTTAIVNDLGFVVGTNALLEGGPKVGPGTYPVFGPQNGPDAGYAGPYAAMNLTTVSDAGTGFVFANSGTITLTSVGTTYAGSFSVAVITSDGGMAPMSGAFNAPFCPEINSSN